MKTRAKLAICGFLSLGLALLAFSRHDNSAKEEIQYSVYGHGPRILLLHDSSESGKNWASSARKLANRFEVTLVDVSNLIADNRAVQRLKEFVSNLELDDSHIAGALAGEQLAIRYALSYPGQSQSFTLPQSSEDLQILADLINSTPFSKS